MSLTKDNAVPYWLNAIYLSDFLQAMLKLVGRTDTYTYCIGGFMHVLLPIPPPLEVQRMHLYLKLSVLLCPCSKLNCGWDWLDKVQMVGYH